MQINVSYDTATRPAGFDAAMQRVVAYLDSEFTNNVQVNLHVGYGTVHGNPIGAGFQAQNNVTASTFSYSSIRSDLVNAATSVDDQSSIQYLPASDPISGTHNWWVNDLQARALGVGSGIPDAWVGFTTPASTYTDNQGRLAVDEWDYDRSDGITADYTTGSGASAVYHHVWDFEATALHEITEIMGRSLGAGQDVYSTRSTSDGIADYTPEDLFRFSSSGVHQYTGRGGYFSPDGGGTTLRYFNPGVNNADAGDWDGTRGDDAFNSPVIRSGVINEMTPEDVRVMDTLGWTASDDYSADTQFSGDLAINYGADPRTVGFGTITGRVNFVGDTDWFRVNLTAGTSYRFNEQGAVFGPRTLYDTNLYLYNSSSVELGRSYSSYVGTTYTPDAELFFTPATSGYYYLSAGADSSVTGIYTLSATPDDYSASVSQGGTVAAGGTAHGSIEIKGDHDWFSVQLTAGITYTFNVGGTGAGLGTLDDSILSLLDSRATLIASDDDSGPGFDSRLVYTPTASGTYYLSVGGYNESHTGTYTVSVSVTFNDPILGVTNFGTDSSAGGWTNDATYPRVIGDVNGDGLADVIGFGGAGAFVSLATGGGHFADPFLAVSNFGATNAGGGWSSDTTYPREVADVNGDGLADIVGFGGAGAFVSLATGGGHFANPFLAVSNFGTSNTAGGWSSDDTYPRVLGDVNGDGLADIIGFGGAGAFVSLATGGGHFADPFLAVSNFGTGPNAGGWSSDTTYPREVADVNGDGLADIVGFGGAGAFVSLATGGGHFASPILGVTNFGMDSSAGGWSSDDTYPRVLGDVNGDGLADIIGFGGAGAFVSLATGGGHFADPVLNVSNFGTGPNAGGWTSDNLYPRMVADVTGDHHADIVGFGGAGVFVSTHV